MAGTLLNELAATYGVRFELFDLVSPPPIGELAGKRRKRARAWRRANPRPWQIDSRREAMKLAEAIREDLGDGDGDGDGP
jgi:hypothetical protein